MLRGNETWTEKDKHLINLKTTRNNLGKLIKYKILILQDNYINYMVAASNVKPSISRNLPKNKGLWTECKNEEMQLSENEALWLAKKNKKTTTTKTIEMFKNQSGAAIFISNFEVARETGFRCCADRIALWGSFDDEFWSSKFLSVWYFFENTLVQINSKLNSKSHDNSTYTNTVFWQKSLHYRLRYKQKNTSHCRFRPSRRQQLAGSYLYPIFLCAG